MNMNFSVAPPGAARMKENIIATNNNKRGESPEKEMYL